MNRLNRTINDVVGNVNVFLYILLHKELAEVANVAEHLRKSEEAAYNGMGCNLFVISDRPKLCSYFGLR